MLSLGRVELPLGALAVLQRFRQVGRREAKMHEVAEATTVAFSVLILATAGFTEVGDGRKLGVERAT